MVGVKDSLVCSRVVVVGLRGGFGFEGEETLMRDHLLRVGVMGGGGVGVFVFGSSWGWSQEGGRTRWQ